MFILVYMIKTVDLVRQNLHTSSRIMNLTYRSEGEVRGSIRRREGNALRNIHRCSFFHKSPDRLHIDQIYRDIISM